MLSANAFKWIYRYNILMCSNQLNVTENMRFVVHSVENIVRKGENAVVFYPFPTTFSKATFFRVVSS